MTMPANETIKSIEVALNNESRERDFYLLAQQTDHQ